MPRVAESEGGKRIRDKRLACFICEQQVLMLARHLQRKHADNTLVAEVMSKTGTERKVGLLKLKNLGSFNHNIKLLKKGEGNLIVVRRSRIKRDPSQYLPCSLCYGFYYKNDLWRHMKFKCPLRVAGAIEDSQSHTKMLSESCRNLLDGAVHGWNNQQHIDKHLNEGVLLNMRKGSTLSIIKSDRLILNFGAALFRRFAFKRHNSVATRMRLDWLRRCIVSQEVASSLNTTLMAHTLMPCWKPSKSWQK